MSEGLPSELRARLDDFTARKPETRDLIDRLIKKHAAAESERERAFIEKMLRDLITPSRLGWWLGAALLVFLACALGWSIWSEKQHQAALASSVPATALIKRMGDGDCVVGTKTSRCLELELEVHREGAAPYTGTLTHDIDLKWMPRVQPGQWITIGVDPKDPNTLLFNEDALSVAPPRPPGE